MSKDGVLLVKYPENCAECRFYDDNWDYPTCYATGESMGYTFNSFHKKMDRCPIKPLVKEPVDYISGKEITNA